MSRALDFLARERPEAVGHYLAFLKANGERLEPRTRNLLSVINKVHSQTERGLRQYARRTIREGGSADEIVDALMMAFPTLGLSRILWAIDILLDMGILAPEDQADEADAWTPAAESGEIAAGGSRALEIAGARILLSRLDDGSLTAYEARCPHGSAQIEPDSGPPGHFTCTRHGRVFDARDGRCVHGGDETLQACPVREVDGRIELRLAPVRSA